MALKPSLGSATVGFGSKNYVYRLGKKSGIAFQIGLPNYPLEIRAAERARNQPSHAARLEKSASGAVLESKTLSCRARWAGKLSVDRCLERKSAHVGCHGLVALWGSLVGGLGATRSSQQQPRAAQESQESSGAPPGRPQGDPENLHSDTFPGHSGWQVCPCKPRLPSPRAP